MLGVTYNLYKQLESLHVITNFDLLLFCYLQFYILFNMKIYDFQFQIGFYTEPLTDTKLFVNSR
jgi:hypothetical protein